MAFLATDMAAGSDAALKLSQNMAAAPNVQENQALQMQMNRAAAQQADANLQKTKLDNLVSESGIQMNQEKKLAIQKLQQSAGWSQKTHGEQAADIAAAIAPFDPKESHLMTQAAAAYDLKEAQAEAKKAENIREKISAADSVMQTWKDDEAGEKFKLLPEEAQKAIIDKVGPAWETMSGKDKKAAVNSLMLSTNQKLQEYGMQLKWQAQLHRDNTELEKQRLHNNLTILAREAKNNKEDRAWKMVASEIDALRRDPDRIKMQEKLDEDVRAAEEEAKKPTTLGGLTSYNPKDGKDQRYYSKDAYEKWQKAVARQEAFLAKQYDREEALIRTLPNDMREIRDNWLNMIKSQRTTFSPEKEASPAATPQKAAGAPATSNTSSPAQQGSPKSPPAGMTEQAGLKRGYDDETGKWGYYDAKGNLVREFGGAAAPDDKSPKTKAYEERRAKELEKAREQQAQKEEEARKDREAAAAKKKKEEEEKKKRDEERYKESLKGYSNYTSSKRRRKQEDE
jgi:hypothetical protein